MGGGRMHVLGVAAAVAARTPADEMSEGEERSPPSSPVGVLPLGRPLPSDATTAALRLADQVMHTQAYASLLCTELAKRIPAPAAPAAASPSVAAALAAREAAAQYHFACNVCTFVNEPSATLKACAMCASPRPPRVAPPPPPVAVATALPHQSPSADDLKTPGLTAAELDALNEARRMLRLTHDMLSTTMLLHQPSRAAGAAAAVVAQGREPDAAAAASPVSPRVAAVSGPPGGAVVDGVTPSTKDDVLTVLFLGVLCPLLVLVLLPSVLAIAVLTFLPSLPHPHLQQQLHLLAAAIRRLATPLWVATARAPSRRLARACHLLTIAVALLLGFVRWRILVGLALLVLVYPYRALSARLSSP